MLPEELICDVDLRKKYFGSPFILENETDTGYCEAVTVLVSTLNEPPPPVYVPVTEVTQSSSVESPIFTITPDLIFSAVRFVVVTPLIVCAPVK